MTQASKGAEFLHQITQVQRAPDLSGYADADIAAAKDWTERNEQARSETGEPIDIYELSDVQRRIVAAIYRAAYVPPGHLSPEWQERLRKMVSEDKPEVPNWDADLSAFPPAEVAAVRAWWERRERGTYIEGVSRIRYSRRLEDTDRTRLPAIRQEILQIALAAQR